MSVDLNKAAGKKNNVATKEEIDLINAAYWGFGNEITRLLKFEININARDENKNSALINCVKARYDQIDEDDLEDRLIEENQPTQYPFQRNHSKFFLDTTINIDILNALIAKGADINITDEYRKTALIYAVEQGNVAAVKIILAKNPDIDHTDCNGNNALSYAVRSDNFNMVLELINAGCNVNMKDEFSDSPLECAVKHQNLALVELLSQYGANPNVKSLQTNDEQIKAVLNLAKINIALVEEKYDVVADIIVKNNITQFNMQIDDEEKQTVLNEIIIKNALIAKKFDIIADVLLKSDDIDSYTNLSNEPEYIKIINSIKYADSFLFENKYHFIDFDNQPNVDFQILKLRYEYLLNMPTINGEIIYKQIEKLVYCPFDNHIKQELYNILRDVYFEREEELIKDLKLTDFSSSEDLSSSVNSLECFSLKSSLDYFGSGSNSLNSSFNSLHNSLSSNKESNANKGIWKKSLEFVKSTYDSLCNSDSSAQTDSGYNSLSCSTDCTSSTSSTDVISVVDVLRNSLNIIRTSTASWNGSNSSQTDSGYNSLRCSSDCSSLNNSTDIGMNGENSGFNFSSLVDSHG